MSATESPPSSAAAPTLTELRVKIPVSWARALTEAAGEQGQSRSALVRFALRQFLAPRLER